MSVMKRLFYWQPRFCPGSRSAVCNIPCVLRHPDGTRRGWPPLTHLHEASTGGQLCGTWLCLPMGIKKGPPRLFPAAVPLFSFIGFRKIQKTFRIRLFLPDGTGPVPSSAGCRYAALSPHGTRPTAQAFPAHAPAEDEVRRPRQGGSVPGARLQLQPQQHLNHIFLYAYTLSAVRTPFIGREKIPPLFPSFTPLFVPHTGKL